MGKLSTTAGPDGTAQPPAPLDHGDVRFRALFEHAPVGVALCAPDGRFREVNATFAELLAGTGIDPEEGGLADLPGRLPEGNERARAWRAGLAAVGSGQSTVARAELPIAPAGAPPRWVQATAARVVLGEREFLLAHLEDTTRRRLEQERLVRLALHDDLTGLANRTLLADRLQDALARAARSGLGIGVLYLDLDGFKEVNDTLGHEAGDRLLIEVARRLSSVLRAGDTAGRMGGDEFLVIAGDMVDENGLHEVGRRIEGALEQPLPVRDGEVLVRASVGAALSRPGESGPALIRRADAAMYAVKRARRRVLARPVPDADAAQQVLLREQAMVAEGS